MHKKAFIQLSFCVITIRPNTQEIIKIMKKFVLLFVVVTSMLIVTACGSSAAAPSAPTTAPAAQAVPASERNQVTITLADNTITASQTSFKVGVLYTFVITNNGSHTHDFNISTPVSAAGSYSAAQANALLSVPQEKLRPGSTVTAQYTFQDSAAGTQLEFSCLIQRHYEDGMRLAITVTK